MNTWDYAIPHAYLKKLLPLQVKDLTTSNNHNVLYTLHQINVPTKLGL